MADPQSFPARVVATGHVPPHQDLVELWAQNPMFASGGPTLCERLAREFPGRQWATDEAVVTAGEPALAQFVVLDGLVRVFHRSPDGRETLVKLLRAPATFGEMELLHDLPFLECVAAMAPTLIAAIPRQGYLELMAANPAVAIEQLRNLAGAFCVAARNELQVMAALDVRLANLLVAFAEVYGQPTSDGLRIELNLPHQRLADCLGVTRRGVLKILAAWRRAGLLRRDGATLALLNPGALAQIARPLAGSLTYFIGKPLAAGREPGTSAQPRAMVSVVRGPRPCLGRRAHVDHGLLIGRAAHCALLLPDETVDPQHCRLFLAATGGRFWIEDLGSLNGTLVNGRPVRRRRVLRPGDEIELGATQLLFCVK